MTEQLLTVLGTGGTISTRPGADGAIPRMTANELASSLGVERVRSRDVFTRSSREIGPAQAWTLAVAIEDEIRGGATGVIVTHGTDTIEETAYALALLVDTRIPVVLTGAMRAPHLPGADGPANLRAAACTASCAAMAAYGPLVVMHDEIHLAPLVTKSHGVSVAAFTSPAAGPVGRIVENEPLLLLGPPVHASLLARRAAPTARVEVVSVCGGDDGLAVESAAQRSDGIVLAATGAGHVSAAAAAAAKSAVAAGIPVVFTSRCADGLTLAETYGGPGSETELLRAGLVRSRFLSPAKARLRLLFGLSAGLAPDELFPSEEKGTSQ
ncbi:asparaginase [Nocardia sp. NBC_01329]|uniref:asparaginase n=1 Tax=Nocardia sp. NBC_01329 TaxID=2903594 RepID=UPI002E12690D|nr:asparaginase [Nocardia sp. NBC_01329]